MGEAYLKISDTISEISDRHARAAVLLLLAEAPAYTLNSQVLRDLLDHLGFRYSRDRLEALFDWLAGEQLIRVERAEVAVLTLRERGADVAHDRARHDGVERPSPPK